MVSAGREPRRWDTYSRVTHFMSSEGWKVCPATTNQRVAPPIFLPTTSTAARATRPSR